MIAPKQVNDRESKLKTIRECFANQGYRKNGRILGWDSGEIKQYCQVIGIDYTESKNLTNAEIDRIYADLKEAKMI